jgi:G3E family GTPase
LIHGVQHCLYPPEHLAQWPWEDRYSRIVMIVRHVDLEQIKKSFQIFMEKLK